MHSLQDTIDEIADGIYTQNALRSRQLKAQVFNIGCIRASIKPIAIDNVGIELCRATAGQLPTGMFIKEKPCLVVLLEQARAFASTPSQQSLVRRASAEYSELIDKAGE